MKTKTLLLILVLTFVIFYVATKTKIFEGFTHQEDYDRLYQYFQEDIELNNPKNLPVQRYYGNTKYLFPLSNNKYCEKLGLISANPPEICCTRKKCDYKANCRCKDPKTGECLSCFPNIPIAP